MPKKIQGLTSAAKKQKAYQNAASFVPKLAVEVVKWLDPQQDDVILDIGCGGTCVPLRGWIPKWCGGGGNRNNTAHPSIAFLGVCWGRC